MRSLDAPPSEGAETAPVDFAFLAEQTFGDVALQREVLNMFVVQARECVPKLLSLSAQAQGELAHRLKGSCQGIGAQVAARAAQRYEDAGPNERPAAHEWLLEAFAAAEQAILAHLASSLLIGDQLG